MAKICIDAGHGGYDPGAIGPGGSKEKDIALSIALNLGKIIESSGIQVAYTRTGDKVPWPASEKDDLAWRCNIANSLGTDLFVSIHCNAAANPTARGMEVFTSVGQGQADRVAEDIIQAWPQFFPDDLIRKDMSDGDSDKEANLYVLRKTVMPAVLIEVGFITNQQEEARMITDAYQNQAALAIATGITKYFGIQSQTPPDNDVSPVPLWKQEIMEDAIKEGLISGEHGPDETASKWFVLAVALNILKVVRKWLKTTV